MLTYSQLIKAHCDAREMEGALDLFEEMLQSGCHPDAHVFTHLIDGCCRIAKPRNPRHFGILETERA